jgi:integrase
MKFYTGDIDKYLAHLEEMQFMRYLGQRKLAFNTIKNVKGALNMFYDYLKDADTNTNFLQLIKGYILYLKDVRNLYISTAKRNMKTVKSFLMWLPSIPDTREDARVFAKKYGTEIEKIITKADIEHELKYILSMRVKIRKIRNDVYVPVELMEMIFNDRDIDFIEKAMLLTLYFTGVRTSDLVHLTREMFDFDQRVLYVPNLKVPNAPYTVPLFHDRYVQFMKEYFNESDSFIGEYMFPARRLGKDCYNPSSLPPMFKRLLKKYADLYPIVARITPQSFRRTFATYIDNHSNLHTASKLLGHSNIRTTEIYLDKTEAVDVKALRSLNESINLEREKESYEEIIDDAKRS